MSDNIHIATQAIITLWREGRLTEAEMKAALAIVAGTKK